MKNSFAEILRKYRLQSGLSQQELAGRIFVERSSVASWETGRRIPDVTMILRIAEALNMPADVLLEQAVSSEAETGSERPAVLVADDEPISLEGAVSILRKTLTGADVTGFTKPSEVLDFARKRPPALTYLDIEIGRMSGFKLCAELLRLHPRTNVIFLTAYADYALDAWSTGACGYAVKPLTADMIRAQLSRLRYPVGGLVR